MRPLQQPESHGVFRPRDAARQFQFLFADCARQMNGRWLRALPLLFSPSLTAIAAYRINRALFLLLGPVWKVLYLLLSPVRFAFHPWTAGCDIHYEADIGGGLLILHPALGVVVSKHAIVGSNCTLTGGNCIGSRRPLRRGALRIGDDVELGANAVVLGPITVGNGVILGAGSVAVRDIPDGEIVAGVPARPLPTTGRRMSPPMRLTKV